MGGFVRGRTQSFKPYPPNGAPPSAPKRPQDRNQQYERPPPKRARTQRGGIVQLLSESLPTQMTGRKVVGSV